jgi:hypothetical protein
MPKRIQPGDEVSLKRDIYRIEDAPTRERTLYASAGEVGVVLEIFTPQATGMGEVKAPAAKVLMGEKIKTFRLTSLSLVSIEEPKKGKKGGRQLVRY